MSKNNWNEKQEKFLRDNFHNMSYEELSQKLDKSTGAIYSKACILKLTKGIVYDNSEEAKLEFEGRIKMKNYSLNINVGENIKILAEDFDNKKGKKKVFQGEVVYKNNRLITIKTKNYKESFVIADFYTRQAVLM